MNMKLATIKDKLNEYNTLLNEITNAVNDKHLTVDEAVAVSNLVHDLDTVSFYDEDLETLKG